jgi:hypothetical protein
MMVERLFTDPNPAGIINSRVVLTFVKMLDSTTLSADRKQQFLDALLMLARKVACVWTHYDRFRKRQEQLEPNAQIIDVESQSPPVEFGYDQDLFMELDEFLVQYKSSLDYLAKIPSPLLGRNKWNPRSFGDKGQRLVKMLNSALPKDQQHTVPAFEDVVLSKHKENLEMLINARDKLNHYVEGGLDYRNFSVFGMKERGVIRLRVPMWSDDQRIVDFMRVSFGNLIGLCEGFIAFFLQYSTKPGLVIFHNPVDPESANSPLRVITQEEMHAQLRSIGRPPDREYLRTK